MSKARELALETQERIAGIKLRGDLLDILEEQFEAMAAAQRELDCRAVCPQCRDGIKLIMDRRGYYWHDPCVASPIRRQKEK
jgi:hypothetical protein